MKKINLLFALLCASTFLYSQKTLEDRASVKIGLIGGWISYEKAFSDKFTLNSELGFEGGFFGGTFYEENFNYVGTLSLSTEPRYYYNIARRIRKNKKTKNNSANFLSVELYYIPNWLTHSNLDNADVTKTFGLVPKYGFNRNITGNLNFEFAFGIGYYWDEFDTDDVAVVLDLRLSFDFK